MAYMLLISQSVAWQGLQSLPATTTHFQQQHKDSQKAITDPKLLHHNLLSAINCNYEFSTHLIPIQNADCSTKGQY